MVPSRRLRISAGALSLALGACTGRSSHEHVHSGAGGTQGGSPSGPCDAGSAACGPAGAPAADPSPCYGGCADTSERPQPGPSPVCPPDPPEVGVACLNAVICGYGDSENSRCRSYYACHDGVWAEDTTLDPCPVLPPDFCSVTPPHEQPCVAGTPGASCEYEGLSCYCTTAVSGAVEGRWTCWGPPANPACPASLPPLGAGCDLPGIQCNYVGDACQSTAYSSVFCFKGYWEPGTPPSCNR